MTTSESTVVTASAKLGKLARVVLTGRANGGAQSVTLSPDKLTGDKEEVFSVNHLRRLGGIFDRLDLIEAVDVDNVTGQCILSGDTGKIDIYAAGQFGQVDAAGAPVKPVNSFDYKRTDTMTTRVVNAQSVKVRDIRIDVTNSLTAMKAKALTGGSGAAGHKETALEAIDKELESVRKSLDAVKDVAGLPAFVKETFENQIKALTDRRASVVKKAANLQAARDKAAGNAQSDTQPVAPVVPVKIDAGKNAVDAARIEASETRKAAHKGKAGQTDKPQPAAAAGAPDTQPAKS